MKALQLTGYGGTDKYQVAEVEIPKPQENEVLVKISAIALNNTDVNTRMGKYGTQQVSGDECKETSWNGEPLKFPFIQGADGCGYIHDMGPNFTSKDREKCINQRCVINPAIADYIKSGNRKIWKLQKYVGSEIPGTYAEYIVVPISQVLIISKKQHNNITDIELSTFLTAYLTAYNMITRANLCENDIILITGASGIVLL